MPRDGTDLRIERDARGCGWYDPYTLYMLELRLRFTASSAFTPLDGGRQ